MAKAGPIEVSRHLLFDDRADWNQFYDPDSARRFEKLARRPEASEPAETSALAAPGAPGQAAPEASIEPAAAKSSEQSPADQSAPTSPPVAATVEGKSPDHDESSTADPFPASTSTQAVTGSLAPASADTHTPGAATATEAPASSVDPAPAERSMEQASDPHPAMPPGNDGDTTSAIAPSESSDQRQSSPPVGDEELPVIPPPPVFPPLAAPNLDERKAGATAPAGSAIAPPAAPLAARAAAHPADRAIAAAPEGHAQSKTRPRSGTGRAGAKNSRRETPPGAHLAHLAHPAPGADLSLCSALLAVLLTSTLLTDETAASRWCTGS